MPPVALVAVTLCGVTSCIEPAVRENYSVFLTKRGNGTVITEPLGIDCRSECAASSVSYPRGTVVRLVASAADAHVFAGWTGDCLGFRSSCRIVMVGDRTVAASFTPGTLRAEIAGGDRTVSIGTAVMLDASGSHDPANRPLAFRWTLSQRPPGSQVFLSTTFTARTSLEPDVPGAYRAAVSVFAGDDVARAEVNVLATEPP